MSTYNQDNDFQGSTPDTPYHKRLREDMSIKNVAYGFYPVATEIRKFEKCFSCRKVLYGEAFRLNGELKCRECMSARI